MDLRSTKFCLIVLSGWVNSAKEPTANRPIFFCFVLLALGLSGKTRVPKMCFTIAPNNVILCFNGLLWSYVDIDSYK